MSVIKWTEIEGFHNVKKYTVNLPEILNGNPVVTYRAKIKLHGNNGGIQVHDQKNNFRVIAQSRTMELGSNNDLAGFAKWTEERAEALQNSCNGLIIFGEWCGAGIQHGVAINQIKDRIFAVFAAKYLSSNEETPLMDLSDVLITDPEALDDLVGNIPGIHVLPWHNQSIEIDWSASNEELAKKTELINEWVVAVEQNDPWVEQTFGVKGTGEGLVFYPVSDDHKGYTNYSNLVFKAKGEAHRVIKTKQPAQVNAESAENATQFSSMVLTLGRLEQGTRAVSENGDLVFSTKFIGKFLAWILSDVEKEAQDELEESGLEWKQVQKTIADRARGWYLSQVNK